MCYPSSYDIRTYIKGTSIMLTLPQATALGTLEHAIMRIVWGHAGPITVRQVFRVLNAEHELAYTTVLTTMTRMADKGLLSRAPDKPDGPRKPGSTYYYISGVSRNELLRAAVEQILNSLGASAAERQQLGTAVQHGVW
jgi:predicted transcriptional regulator